MNRCCHLAHGEIGEPCREEALWYATVVIGAWMARILLCEEHARVYALMMEVGERAAQAYGRVIDLPVKIKMVAEIYSLPSEAHPLPELYEMKRLIWKCSECELPIVRSLETGRWVLTSPTASALAGMQVAADHEHVPG